jgi:putative sterol carrier protein
MTWQGGKLRREASETLPFARLRALAGPEDDATKSLEQLTKAMSGLGKPVRLHIQLVSGADGETVEHWDVQGGKGRKAKKGEPKNADVVVVMRPETWAQIAQGQLAPYEALYSGRLRVGGDFEIAKAVVKHWRIRRHYRARSIGFPFYGGP